MKVTTLQSAPFASNIHVVECGDEVLVVDTGSGTDSERVHARLRDVVDPARVTKVYLTHWHVDHVGGAAALRGLTGAEFLMHEDEADAVEEGDATRTLGAMMGLRQEPCPVTRVADGAKVTVGDRTFEVLLTPGHSPAHTCLYEPASRSLFAGDLVFDMGSFGRVDFPGCDPAAMLGSIERVARLDVNDLYAGHMGNVKGTGSKAIEWSLENARAMLG